MWTDGRTDGQTDVTKLMVAIRNFEKSPKYERSTYKVSQKSINDVQVLLSVIKPFTTVKLHCLSQEYSFESIFQGNSSEHCNTNKLPYMFTGTFCL